MNDKLKDVELVSHPSSGKDDGHGSGTPRWPWAVAAAVLLLGVIALVWFRSGEPEEVVEPTEPQAPVAAEPVERDDSGDLIIGEVPPLADSDDWIRGIVSQISSHPQLAEWLLTPELVRGFVVVVDNIAEGTAPRKHLEMMAPETAFGVRESGGKVFIDPASYNRFDRIVEVIDSLDTEGMAELFEAMRPLYQQAYEDLGYPGEDFDATLSRAVNRLLAVPVVDQPIEIEKKVTAYRFTDPALEGLSPAAKQFLRLGPQNLQKLQSKVRELARAIGLEGVE